MLHLPPVTSPIEAVRSNRGGTQGRQMKWLTVVALSLALLGCRADLEQQAAKCELEARKTYPTAQNIYAYAPANRLIELCMRASGYDFDPSHLKCALPDNIVSADCYVPRSEWDRTSRTLENWLRGSN